MKEESKLLTRREAATYLRLGISTIDKMLAQKKLKPTRIGRRVLFLKEDLDQFILENRENFNYRLRNSSKEDLKKFILENRKG